MPVKDIFPLSLVTPVFFAKISRWRRQIDTHLVFKKMAIFTLILIYLHVKQ